MSKGWDYKPGNWYVTCDVCAKKILASDSKKRWDGFIVCADDFEHRHPQDFILSKTDKISVPFSRPQQQYVDVNEQPTARILGSTPRTSDGLIQSQIEVLGGSELELYKRGTRDSATYTVNGSKQIVISDLTAGAGRVTYVRGVWKSAVPFRYEGFFADVDPDYAGDSANYLSTALITDIVNSPTSTTIQLTSGISVGDSVQVYYTYKTDNETSAGDNINTWPHLHKDSFQETANDGDLYIMGSLYHAYRTTGEFKYKNLADRICNAQITAGAVPGNYLSFNFPLVENIEQIGVYAFAGTTTAFSWTNVTNPVNSTKTCLKVQTTVLNNQVPAQYAGWGSWPSWNITTDQPFESIEFSMLSDGSNRNIELWTNIDPNQASTGDCAVLVPLTSLNSSSFTTHQYTISDFWKVGNVVYDSGHKEFSYTGSYGSNTHAFGRVYDTVKGTLVGNFTWNFVGNVSGYSGAYFGNGDTNSSGTTTLHYSLYVPVATTVKVVLVDNLDVEYNTNQTPTVATWTDYAVAWPGGFTHPLKQIKLEPVGLDNGSIRVDSVYYDSIQTMESLNPTVINGFSFKFPPTDTAVAYTVYYDYIRINQELVDGPSLDVSRYEGIPRWTYKWIGSGSTMNYGAWRGPSAPGYMWLDGVDPTQLIESNNVSMVNSMRQFLFDSQNKYYETFYNQSVGPFMPRYGRPSWEAMNTAGYVGPTNGSPTTTYSTDTYNEWYIPTEDNWYGYQYRAFLSAARDYYYTRNNISYMVATRFLNWVAIKLGSNSNNAPTDFKTDGTYTYDDMGVYPYAMIAQACLYMYYTDGNSNILTVARTCIDKMYNTYRKTQTGQLLGFYVQDGGSGYTTATVNITGNGSSAAGTAVIKGGRISYITVTNAGSNYSTISATITGDGTGAVVTPYLSDKVVGAFSNEPYGWEQPEVFLTYAMLVIGPPKRDIETNIRIFPTVNDIRAMDGLVEFYRRNISNTKPTMLTTNWIPLHEFATGSYHNSRGINDARIRDAYGRTVVWTETIGPVMRMSVEWGRYTGDWSWLNKMYQLLLEFSGGVYNNNEVFDTPVTVEPDTDPTPDPVEDGEITIPPYSPSVTYNYGDTVTYNNQTWYSTSTTPHTGNTPTSGSLYWSTTFVTAYTGDTYSSSSTYDIGESVTYNGITYYAYVNDITNITPTNATYGATFWGLTPPTSARWQVSNLNTVPGTVTTIYGPGKGPVAASPDAACLGVYTVNPYNSCNAKNTSGQWYTNPVYTYYSGQTASLKHQCVCNIYSGTCGSPTSLGTQMIGSALQIA